MEVFDSIAAMVPDNVPLVPAADAARLAEGMLASRNGLGHRGLSELKESVGTFVTFNAAMTGFFGLYAALFVLLETTSDDVLLSNCEVYTQFLFAGGLAVGIAAAVADFLFDISRLIAPIRHCYYVGPRGEVALLEDPEEMEKDLELVWFGKSSNSIGGYGNVNVEEYIVEVIGSCIIIFVRLLSNVSLVLLMVVILCYNYFAEPSGSPDTIVVVESSTSSATLLEGTTPSFDCFIEGDTLEDLLTYTALVAGVLLLIRAVVLPKWKYRGMDETSLRAVLQNMSQPAREALVMAIQRPRDAADDGDEPPPPEQDEVDAGDGQDPEP